MTNILNYVTKKCPNCGEKTICDLMECGCIFGKCEHCGCDFEYDENCANIKEE